MKEVFKRVALNAFAIFSMLSCASAGVQDSSVAGVGHQKPDLAKQSAVPDQVEFDAIFVPGKPLGKNEVSRIKKFFGLKPKFERVLTLNDVISIGGKDLSYPQLKSPDLKVTVEQLSQLYECGDVVDEDFTYAVVLAEKNNRGAGRKWLEGVKIDYGPFCEPEQFFSPEKLEKVYGAVFYLNRMSYAVSDFPMPDRIFNRIVREIVEGVQVRLSLVRDSLAITENWEVPEHGSSDLTKESVSIFLDCCRNLKLIYVSSPKKGDWQKFLFFKTELSQLETYVSEKKINTLTGPVKEKLLKAMDAFVIAREEMGDLEQILRQSLGYYVGRCKQISSIQYPNTGKLKDIDP